MAAQGPAGDETERNDREGGRQLAWVSACGTLIGLGLAVFFRLWGGLVAVVLAVGAGFTILAFMRPIIAIRIAGGRFSELVDDPIARAISEGTPMPTAAVEQAVPRTQRRVHLGLGGTIAGAVLLVSTILAASIGWVPADSIPILGTLSGGLLLWGLVLWYRAKHGG